MTIDEYITGRLFELECEVKELNARIIKINKNYETAFKDINTLLNLIECGYTHTTKGEKQFYLNIWDSDTEDFNTIRDIYNFYMFDDPWKEGNIQ